jgi:hypothetical protein
MPQIYLRLVRTIVTATAFAMLLPAALLGQSARPADTNSRCAPPVVRAPAGLTLMGTAGDFALTMTATAGPRAGNWVEGRVRLATVAAQWDSVRQDSLPAAVVGWFRINLDTLGARTEGGVDDHFGGVAVEYRGRADDGQPYAHVRLSLRGTGLPADVMVFDGVWTRLEVTAISGGHFAGYWTSGAGASERAGGYFCAVKR